jgi:hypothetical protein
MALGGLSFCALGPRRQWTRGFHGTFTATNPLVFLKLCVHDWTRTYLPAASFASLQSDPGRCFNFFVPMT